MPFHYRIYPEPGILIVQGEGAMTQAERVETMLAWLADPAYQACVDALCDFSKTDSIPSRADLDELVTLLKEHIPARGPTKVAMVAPQIITFGVARVFEEMVHLGALPLQVKVFADRKNAWAWLRPGAPPVDQDLGF